jgi:hypothetical protein
LEKIFQAVTAMIAQWQDTLGPEVEVVLGGSLISGLFVLEGADVVDVDVRFLVSEPADETIRRRVEMVTGLAFRKVISVADWPAGSSVGVMVEGRLEHPELPLPLDVEGCIRNRAYVGWARFYQLVLTPDELAEIRDGKLRLRADKKAYKAFKSAWRDEVERRALAAGLVSRQAA